MFRLQRAATSNMAWCTVSGAVALFSGCVLSVDHRGFLFVVTACAGLAGLWTLVLYWFSRLPTEPSSQCNKGCSIATSAGSRVRVQAMAFMAWLALLFGIGVIYAIQGTNGMACIASMTLATLLLISLYQCFAAHERRAGFDVKYVFLLFLWLHLLLYTLNWQFQTA